MLRLVNFSTLNICFREIYLLSVYNNMVNSPILKEGTRASKIENPVEQIPNLTASCLPSWALSIISGPTVVGDNPVSRAPILVANVIPTPSIGLVSSHAYSFPCETFHDPSISSVHIAT